MNTPIRITGKSLRLPSTSPRNSPTSSPVIPHRSSGPRSVTWSLPSQSQSIRGGIDSQHSLPIIRHEQEIDLEHGDVNTLEFLAWRRLHLSKAKLSGITEMACLMAGFAVVATVELQINDDANPILLSAFTVVTALLVCTTMMAIMISTCILPHIQVVAKMCPDSKPNESPHDRMMWYIDLSWVLANSIAIFLFTLDVILLSWIKFTYFSETASWCATIIMIPVLIFVCVFGIIFYRKIVKHQYIVSDRKYQELEEMKRQLETNTNPVFIV